jgi:hypothetical protein
MMRVRFLFIQISYPLNVSKSEGIKRKSTICINSVSGVSYPTLVGCLREIKDDIFSDDDEGCLINQNEKTRDLDNEKLITTHKTGRKLVHSKTIEKERERERERDRKIYR